MKIEASLFLVLLRLGLFWICLHHPKTTSAAEIEFGPLLVTHNGGTNTGGTISAEPEKASYTAGETILLTAVPVPGWEFHHWEHIEGEGPPLSYNPQIELQVGEGKFAAVFAQVLPWADREVRYIGSGAASVAPETETLTTRHARFFVHSKFKWIEPDAGVASFHLSGHNIAVVQDGLTLFRETGFIDERIELFIPEGGAKIEIRAPTSPGILSCTLSEYRFEHGFTLDVLAVAGGNADFQPARDYYVYGEEVRISAIPDEGFYFAGWTGTNAPVNSSATIQFPMTAHRILTASFFEVDPESSVRWTAEGDQAWTSIHAATSEGDSVALAPPKFGQARLTTKITGPAVLAFEAAIGPSTASGSPALAIAWGNHVSTIRTGAREIKLGEGDWDVVISANNATDSWIGNFRLHPGHPVHVRSRGDGTVEGSPPGLYAVPGEWVTLTAVPDEGAEFFIWSDNYEFVSSPVLHFQFEGRGLREAFFTQTLEWNGRRWRTDAMAHWTPADESISGRPLVTGQFKPWIESEWTGPGVIRYRTASKAEITVNGKLIEPVRSSVSDPWSVPVPDGSHVVRWTASSGRPTTLRDLEWTNGYLLRRRVAGGTFIDSPAGDIFEPESSVTLLVEGGADHPFLGWQGTTTSTSRQLSLNMDQHHDVEAVFGRELGIANLNFTTGGNVLWKQSTAGSVEAAAVSEPNGGEAGWLEAILDGPGELRFRASASAYLGVFVDGLERWFTNGTTNKAGRVLLDEGTHKVRWRAIGAEGDLTSATLDAISFQPGYAVFVTAPGGNVLGLPDGSVPPETTLALAAIPTEGNRFVEWTGSLESAESALELTVTNHTFLNARFEAERLAEFPVVAASENSDWHFELGGDGSLELVGRSKYQEQIWIEFEIEGPKLIEFEPRSTVYINGIWQWPSRAIQLSADKHRFRWQFEAQTLDDGTIRITGIQLTDGYQLETRLTSPPHTSGVIQQDPPGTMFEHGETVQLQYESGRWFDSVLWEVWPDADWKEAYRISGPGLLLEMTNRFLVFGGPATEALGVPLLLLEDEAEWRLETAPAPDTGPLLIAEGLAAGGTALARSFFDRPHAIRFAWKLTGEGATARFGSARAGHDWQTEEVIVEPDPVIYMTFEFTAGNEPASQLLLKDVMAERVYQLEVLEMEGGTVLVEPSLPYYPSGTEVRLTPVPNQNNVFLRWAGDVAGRSNPLHVVIEEDLEIKAEFAVVFQTGNVEWRRFHLPYNSHGPSWHIAAGFEGPGVLQLTFDFPFHIGLADNGTWHNFEVIEHEGRIDWLVEPGHHQIEVISTNRLTLLDSQFLPGFGIQAEVPGGASTLSPRKTVYELGDEVTVTAFPPAESEFHGWTGDFAGLSQEATIVVQGHVRSTADVVRVHSIEGRKWFSSAAWPWNPRPPNQAYPISRWLLESPLQMKANGTAWLETIVTGPTEGSFLWGLPESSPLTEAAFFISGERIEDCFTARPLLQRTKFAVGPGDHRLRWEAKPRIHPAGILYGPVVLQAFEVSEPVPDSPKRTWLGGHFSPAELAADPTLMDDWLDPDHDSIPTRVEHVFNLDPRAQSSLGIHAAISRSVVTWTFPTRRGAAPIFHVKISHDLLSWSPLSAQSVNVTEEALDEQRALTTVSALTSEVQPADLFFLRLQIQ